MSETTSSAPLLPCPFCGASARGYEIEPHQHSAALLALVPDMPKEHHGSYVIEGDCQCGSGLIGDNQAEVTARWNARAPQAVEAQAPAAVAVPGEREAYIDWLSGSHPRVFSKADAEAYWRNEHVSALAWQARAALAATPALPATELAHASMGLTDALRNLIEAIEYTPLGIRQIKALERARAAIKAGGALPATEDSSAGDLAEGPAGSDGWKVHAESLEKECAYWKTLAETMRAHQSNDVWYWQGDGNDNPASMVNSLAVVIRADDLRDLMAKPQAEARAQCMHRIADARNPVVKSGYLCVDCGALFSAADHDAPQAQPADAPIAYLQEADQHLLHRFIETTEDDESFDIGKDAVKRLANLGVVESCGFGRYGVTMFGYWVHEHYWHQNPSLPLKTNADRDREHRAAMAAAQEGGNAAKDGAA